MQKKSNLILAQATLMFITIVVFGIIITFEKGNIFLKKYIQKKIDNYYQEYYQKDDLKKSDLIYDKNNQTYYITYSNKINKDHNFKITYHKNKITSTYDNDYIKGKQILKKRSNKIQKEWKKTLQDTIYQSCNILFYDLDKYQKKSQEQILKSNNLKESGLYQIECQIDTYDHSDKKTNELFKTLDTITTSNNFLPKSYTLILRDDGIIKKITRKKGEL